MTSILEGAPPQRGAALEARSIRKSFGGVNALRGVSLSVAPGTIHALVGENGAGKSTLIKILTGVYRQDSGEILYEGSPVQFGRPSDAQDVGISTVYQEISLIPLMSVARNIFLGREPRNRMGLINVREMDRRAQETTERLGIHVDVTENVGRLGLGMQQMVALVRATVIDAHVVIMDEPTSSLEHHEVETLFAVARRLRDEGTAIVFVSHRLDELWEICDSVTVLRDGEVVHEGAMADLSRRELISHMLGKDISEVREGKLTDFDGGGDILSRQPVLQVTDIVARPHLQGVSLDVLPGEIVGLGGLLGSGRTETVRAIYGDLHTNSGEVTLDGKPLRKNSVRAALRAGIALLSEDRKAEGIIPALSVRDNIVLAILPKVSRFGVLSDKRINSLVDDYVQKLHIKVSSPRQLVSQLSGGNQQKVLIARWLATDPRVFLMDEPTRGIDVGAKQEVATLIDQMAARGIGVIMVSSETEELVEGANRVIVLRDGAVVEELRGDDLTQDHLLAALVADQGRDRDPGASQHPGEGTES